MPNPPITGIDFATGAAVVKAGPSLQFTFPIKGLTPGTVLPPVFLDPRDGMAALDKKLDTILAFLRADPPPPPPPTATAWPIAAPVAGQVNTLPPGTFTGSQHFGDVLTLQGAGSRRTVLDGQKGIGAGHKLAWGKGVVHVTAPNLTQDIGFKGGGGADGRSDGEAGYYAEAVDGIARALRCAFDGCENGAFTGGGAAYAKQHLVIEACAFGKEEGNGIADGSSHDLYVNCGEVSVLRSVFHGTSRANTIKSRSPKLTITGNYIARANGRWVDLPGATNCISTGNTYVTLPRAGSQNAIGLWDEGDTSVTPGSAGSFVSKGDTLVFSRWKEVIWINHPDALVSFTDARVFWVGPLGSAPPIVEILGPGKLTGPNPFTFTPSNRLDVPPPIPADPT